MTSDPPRDITDLPYDMTAATLAEITNAMRDADFDKADILEALNDQLLTLLHSEGDGTRTLARQSQILDAIFNLLVQASLFSASDDAFRPQAGKPAKAAPNIPTEQAKVENSDSPSLAQKPSVHLETLGMALRTQSLTTNTIKTSHVIDYMRDLRKIFDSKKKEPPTPLILPNELKDTNYE